jgi:FkbM family methyltransferase
MKLLIEVGAYDGNDSLQYHKNGYVVYTFEPKKDLFESLFEKTKSLNNYTVINKAVCLENGTKLFNICKKGGASSLLEFRSDEELEKSWSAARTDIQYSGKSYDVDTIRLDTFIENEGLQNTPIDYIHIDAQGVDLECLMSLGKYIKNVKAGVLETIVKQEKSIYVNQITNTFDNIKDFIEKNNFHITNVENNDRTNCEYNVYFQSLS